MIKFSHLNKPAVEDYWAYCNQHEIPHIEIIAKSRDYVRISYDLLPCLPSHKLEDDLLDNVIKIYKAYSVFFKLPKARFDFSGGYIALGIVVKKEHSEFIVRVH